MGRVVFAFLVAIIAKLAARADEAVTAVLADFFLSPLAIRADVGSVIFAFLAAIATFSSQAGTIHTGLASAAGNAAAQAVFNALANGLAAVRYRIVDRAVVRQTSVLALAIRTADSLDANETYRTFCIRGAARLRLGSRTR